MQFQLEPPEKSNLFHTHSQQEGKVKQALDSDRSQTLPSLRSRIHRKSSFGSKKDDDPQWRLTASTRLTQQKQTAAGSRDREEIHVLGPLELWIAPDGVAYVHKINEPCGEIQVCLCGVYNLFFFVCALVFYVVFFFFYVKYKTVFFRLTLRELWDRRSGECRKTIDF